MAMGRQGDRQGDLMVTWSEMPRSPGHVFYDRLQEVLVGAGFDGFVEEACRAYYARTMGAPSVPPGRYFRMHMVGSFEGIDSERGIEWRCLGSSGRRNTLREEGAMTVRKRRSDRSGRGALPSPGRPSVARREDRHQFWAAIAAGRSSEDAAVGAGVSPAVGAR